MCLTIYRILLLRIYYIPKFSLHALCASVVMPANISLSDVKYFFVTRKFYGQPGECAYTFSTRQKINTLRPEIEFERVNRPAAYYSMYVDIVYRFLNNPLPVESIALSVGNLSAVKFALERAYVSKNSDPHLAFETLLSQAKKLSKLVTQ